MKDKLYISVILPLKLEWEPVYYVSCSKGAGDETLGDFADDSRKIPSGQLSPVSVGDRVKVNFAGRNYIAVVSGVGVEPATEISKIKEAVLDEDAIDAVSYEEILFWRRVADYYLCTVGEVYKAAYPSGKTDLEAALAARRLRDKVRRERMAAEMEAKRQRELQRQRKKIADLEKRIERLMTRIGSFEARIAGKKGQIERALKSESRERYISELEKLSAGLDSLASEKSGLDVLLCQYRSHYDELECRNTSSLTGVETVGFVDNSVLLQKATGSGTAGHPYGSLSYMSSVDCGFSLTEAQETAYEQIQAGFKEGKPVMLHGVTGAGKTEIYMKLAADVIAGGRNVLYLVPEIALSRQLEERLKNHFHTNFFIFHSGESAVQKRDIADSIRHITDMQDVTCNTEGICVPDASGAVVCPYLVLGTRSALFLPHRNLGLIIVDEEHDPSYKQESPAPRYNGRDAALMLSQIQTSLGTSRGEGICNIILGSATPSLEEVYNCASGRHTLVRLTERFHGAGDSDIEIIDTRAERRKKGMVGSFSRKLIFKIESVLSEGGQVMVLRSRRAWSTAMQCSECGEIVKCPHCNVSLSLHGRPENGRFVCHYCGYSRKYEDACPKCGRKDVLMPMVTGTQRIEEELVNLFPNASVARLDSDSAKSAGSGKSIVKAFSEGKVNILVGTQIVAKGFDFSNLRLVAVIAADSLLGIQDFRADEKAMHLLEQFRGRCGRREHKGIFVIQTSHPDHPIYQSISNRQADNFTYGLMLERKEFGFPPYSRIVEIQVKDKCEERAASTSSVISDALRQKLMPVYSDISSVVTGPYTPIPDKVADNYLRMIRVSLKKDKNLSKSKSVILDVVRQIERKSESQIIINVDPS